MAVIYAFVTFNFLKGRENDIIFEKYHQSYAKITTFSVFKGVPKNLVLCMLQNLRTTIYLNLLGAVSQDFVV